ncbi:MAG TPA: copper amine oxidase N-terminal domain-containing protein [Syntrophomonadaceae bacterium]|nr:copper amine oxidase N-terminal domain-containing protein [Syntrophomonadaceae bacterium]
MKLRYHHRLYRRVTSILIISALLVTMTLTGTAPAFAESDIIVKLNGNILTTDTSPKIVNSRVLLPMRIIFEAVGATLEWNGATQVITAKKDDTVVIIQVGSNTAKVNGSVKVLDTPAVIENNRTLVPVRFVTESLGCKVDWDKINRIVSIQTSAGESGADSTQTADLPKDKTGNFVSGERLMEDTDFYYAQNKQAKFKADTVVEFYPKTGYISQGVLAQNTELEYAPGKSTVFKANRPVTFNSKGYVEKADLAEPTTLEYAPNQSLLFKDMTVEFSDNGYVARGIPVEDPELRFQDGVRTLFSKDKEVAFYPNGNVRKATPKRDAYLQYNQDKLSAPAKLDNTDGHSATFPAGEEVSFHPNGLVEKGVLYQDTALPYNYNQYLVFKKGSTVTFSSDGYVTKGIIRDNQYLPYREDKHLDVAPSQEVVFEKGLLKEATLLYDTKLEYRSDSELEFKAGTRVYFNDKGYVIRGTLTSGSKIKYDPTWEVLIMGDKEVEFNSQGYIKSGYLADYFSSDKAVYAEHTKIEFDDNGKVLYGTLRDGVSLPLGNGYSVECKAGTEVFYHPNYTVKEATLRSQAKLPFSHDLTNANQILLMGDTKITFNEKGYISSATLFQDTLLSYAKDQVAEFKGGTVIEFYDSGYVKSGTLKKDTELNTNLDTVYHAPAGCKVYFDTAGLLERVER